ncbi:hypothetical protein [Vibrio phage vB_VhaS-a]|nr:hypothetical protein [Vibrio phage vB_VhaS-a]
MNTTETLKELLGIGVNRVSGRVVSIGSNVQLATSNGVVVVPVPNIGLTIDDVVIVEGGQILYNVGNKGNITTYEV